MQFLLQFLNLLEGKKNYNIVILIPLIFMKMQLVTIYLFIVLVISASALCGCCSDILFCYQKSVFCRFHTELSEYRTHCI